MQRGPSISILGVSYILILSGKGARYPFPLSLTLTVTRSSLQLGTVTKQLSYDCCFPNGCRQVHHPLPSCAAFAFMPPSSMSSMILSVNSQETIPGEMRYIPSSFELSIRILATAPSRIRCATSVLSMDDARCTENHLSFSRGFGFARLSSRRTTSLH